MLKWDNFFIELANMIASSSKDPEAKVGCVIVDDDRNILSSGYNGFPRNIKDDERLQSDYKLKIIVHAEANAVAAAARNGHSIKNGTCYITRPPCSQCACLLIQSGITNIIYKYRDDTMSKWKENHMLALDLLTEAGVGYICYREE